MGAFIGCLIIALVLFMVWCEIEDGFKKIIERLE